ncbi:glycosyltransferase [Bosea sp. TAB14]|uniref:glycosyltransferase n=1 Tax=Bosea sp. TAB14 TaxID=3237481 RepID=UPI003F90AA68
MSAAEGAPLRILHVFRAPLGGLFRHVLDVARGQAERGHEVGIFCDATTGGARADEVFSELAQTLSLGITRVPMSRYPSRTDVKAQLAEMALRRRLDPDIVHCHGSKGGVYGRVPALLSPQPQRGEFRPALSGRVALGQGRRHADRRTRIAAPA